MADTDLHNDEISLLDIAVVIAEHWLLLVIAPIVATILTFGILATITPSQYTSEAIVRLSAEDAELVTSARILNPAILNSDYLEGFEGALSQARQNIVDNNLEIGARGEGGLYSVSVTADSAASARSLLNAIINSLIENSTPTTYERSRLELQLQLAETSIGELNATLSRLNRIADDVESGGSAATATLGEIGQSIVALLSNIETRQAEMLRVREALEGSVNTDDIIQPATEPDGSASRGLLVRSILVGLGLGFVLLIGVFIRSGLRSAADSPEQRDKVNRIRKAFWLKPVASN